MLQAGIATLLFAFVYALQIVLQELFVRSTIEPLHLNFLSYSLAAVIMTGYFLYKDRKTFMIRPSRRVLLIFAVSVIGWITADFFAVYGLKFSSSVNYSILSRTMTFVVFLLSMFFLHERFSWIKAIAAIVAVAGSILVVYRFGTKVTVNPGDIFFLITIVTLSISSVVRPFITKTITSVQLSYAMFLTAAVILGLITFVFYPITYPVPVGAVLVNAAAAMVGFNLVNYAIAKGGPVFFTLVSNLLPVFTVLLSFLILGNVPTIIQFLGGMLIVFSIFLYEGRWYQSVKKKFKVKRIYDRS